MPGKLRSGHYLFFIAIVAIVLYIPFLGKVNLFDWDEINFAECSREMIATGDFSRVHIDFKPFWEKPPLFFWLQVASMRMFGITEFAARFPNAICGVSTLIILFLCGKKIYDARFGLLWALAFAGSFFPGIYFKSGIIDPWFNLFTFLSIYFFILYNWKRNDFEKQELKKNLVVYTILSGVFMGLAILTKGPAALLIFFLMSIVYFILNRFKFYFNWSHAILFLMTGFFVVFLWYGYEYFKHGPGFINNFLRYQFELLTKDVAGHNGFFGYHFVVILFGCFPASVFAIPSFFKTIDINRYDKDFRKWMLILFCVVLILFSIVESRIIHYSALAWFPVSFLAAHTFYKWHTNNLIYKKYTIIVAGIVGGIITLILIIFPFFALNIKKFIPYVKDKFAQENMRADVNWTGFESLIGVLLLSAIITGLIQLNKHRYVKAAYIFFSGTAIVVFLTTAIIVPKLEKYTQAAAINFLKEISGEDCYVQTLGYKSYAPYFYTQKKRPANENSDDENWLLAGDIDKPVYFLSRVDRLESYKKYTELKELFRKNGFIFLKREIPLK